MTHAYYEIRRGKETLCSGTAPNLGYSPEYLKEILKAGYSLYRNGKRVKLCDIQ